MTYPNINDQFKSIGNDFRSNIPHIMIGKQGISTQNNSNLQQNQPKPLPQQIMYTRTYQNAKKPYSEEDIVEKIRKWALIITICIVVGYAGWRILNIFIGG